MTVNEKKAKVQAEANAAIDANGGFGLIAMATGTGKSKIGVDRASNIYEKSKKIVFGLFRILLVVPTEKLRDEGWKEEFTKWNKVEVYKEIERTCYASLHTYEYTEWDLVIMDEVHNTTPYNSIFFKNNTIKSCIALTATPPKDPVKQQILKENKLNLVYEITLDQAVEMELVAPYEITVVTMKLDDKDKYIKKEYKDKKTSQMKSFMQTELDNYIYLTKSVEFGSNPMSRINRMRFMYNLKSKTVTAQGILKNVIPQDKRTLIFCGSKEQANQVCEHRYYSKPTPPKRPKNFDEATKVSDKKIKEYADKAKKYLEQMQEFQGNKSYSLFFEGTINRLSCVDALNEGVNLPMIDCGLMVKLDSQELNFIQKLGRFLRIREGHIGKIIILAVEDTVDIEWVNKAMAKIDNTKVTWITLDDLRNARQTITF